MAGGNKQEKQTTSTQNTSSISNLAPGLGLQPSLLNLVNSVSATPSGLTDAETTALNNIVARGQAGNPFTGQISNVANTLLSGGGPDRTGIVNDAYKQYQDYITPTARGDYLNPATNPFFNDTTTALGNDAQKRINDAYAASGRDPTGAGSYGYNLGKGVSEATAPVFASVYQGERGNQLGAINNLFSAGGTTASLLSGLDQTRLGNMATGAQIGANFPSIQNAGDLQVLQAEAQRRGIPLQTLLTQLGAVAPIAAQFGTQTQVGTGTGTSNEVTESKPNILNQILGGAIGGVGLLGGLGGFGSNGWLYSTGSGGGGLLNGLGTKAYSAMSDNFSPGRYY